MSEPAIDALIVIPDRGQADALPGESTHDARTGTGGVLPLVHRHHRVTRYPVAGFDEIRRLIEHVVEVEGLFLGEASLPGLQNRGEQVQEQGAAGGKVRAAAGGPKILEVVILRLVVRQEGTKQLGDPGYVQRFHLRAEIVL